MDKLELQALKDRTPIEDVIGRYVKLIKVGNDYEALCPFHDEETPSFRISTSRNIFKCFGCGKGGDVLEFLMCQGKSFPDAVKEIQDPNNVAGVVPFAKESRRKEEPKEEWRQLVPAVPMKGIGWHPEYGYPTDFYEYIGPENELLGYTCRYKFINKKGEEKKKVLPIIYATNGTKTKWVLRGFPSPKPLNNQYELKQRPDAPVLLVEGEKTFNAAKSLYPKAVVETWVGGRDGVRHVDWAPLKGRLIIYAPDNDVPGFDAMHEIHSIIKDDIQEALWMKTPVDAFEGWDIADSGWTVEQAREYAQDNIIDYPGPGYTYENRLQDPEQKEEEEELEEKEEVITTLNVVKGPGIPKGPPNEDNPEEKAVMGMQFFRFLGIRKEDDGMMYYFFSKLAKSVIGLSASGMTKNNLMQLAPLNWWENSFETNRNGLQVDQVANYLIRTSAKFGAYSDKWVRGRGAWVENDKVVVHAGDKLIVNGTEMQLGDFETKYMYEMGEPLELTIGSPVSHERASKLIDLLKMLKWERPIDLILLAGFCVVAPVCGALPWRPHVWVTGAAGTGKSWVMKSIIKRMLGETCHTVAGQTTEPGLRQLLNHDALPIVFDEAEGEDKSAQERMQAVLSLMRSSSNDIGIVAKGGSKHAKKYTIRSCFAFSSIAVQLSQQSDRTRVTVLGLLKNTDPDARKHWEEIQEMHAGLMTDEFCEGVRSLTLSNLPNILANIKMFTNAASAVIGEQRSGDQVGVLLAGAYSLVSPNKIDYDTAYRFVSKYNWDEEVGLSGTRDEVALISHIMESLIMVDTNIGVRQRAVGEIVLLAMGLEPADGAMNPLLANDCLARMGLKVIKDCLVVSNTDKNIRKFLEGTAWAKNHNKILMRLEGAKQVTARFSSMVGKGVAIHKSVLFGDYEPSYKQAERENQAVVDKVVEEVSKPVKDEFTQDPEIDMPF